MSIAKYLSEKTADIADNLCPAKRERRKDARPGELLEAALDLFVEKGFAATRAEEVARRAGVSKGTLFLYFQSKEELFKAVVQDNLSRCARRRRGGRSKALAPNCRHLPMQWWVRGDTKARASLMISEANNLRAGAVLPERGGQPGTPCCQVLQRGIARGEFRPADVHHTATRWWRHWYF
jgi:TetR/AcrR family transcriptional regulator